MNKYISEFLDRVCKEIKCKNILGDILAELQGHIHELMEGYIESGMSESKAAEKAVEQMGDPIYIGKELNKTHRPKTEWSIISIISIMVLIGGVALFSIANDKVSFINLDQFLKNYLVYILIGVCVCTACYFFDYTKLEKYSLYIFIATIVFLFLVAKFGHRVYFVPYIRIGKFSFSPVPIALPFFLVSFSGLANVWANGSIKNMLKLLVLASLAVIAYMVQPSSATAMLLSAGFLIIITKAIMSKGFKGSKKRFLFSIYGIGLLCSILGLVNIMTRYNYYPKMRMFIFLNPELDPEGAGYINIILKKMLLGAKLFGKSDNLYLNHQGVNKIVLPEVNTEFIFTYIVSAFGWIAGIITIVVITLAVVRMFLATRKINHQYGRYLASSIVTVFTLQSLANILMNMGLFPISGFSLPFISYGGTNFVINMALIGLLLGVYRRKDLVKINSVARNYNKHIN